MAAVRECQIIAAASFLFFPAELAQFQAFRKAFESEMNAQERASFALALYR